MEKPVPRIATASNFLDKRKLLRSTVAISNAFTYFLFVLIGGCAIEGRNLNEEETQILCAEIRNWNNTGLPYCDQYCQEQAFLIRIVYTNQPPCNASIALACYWSGPFHYPTIYVLHEVAQKADSHLILQHEFAHALLDFTTADPDSEHVTQSVWVYFLNDLDQGGTP